MKWKTALSTLAVLLASACSSVSVPESSEPKQSALELVNEASKKYYGLNSQYEFDGKFYFSMDEASAPAAKLPETSQAADEQSAEAAADPDSEEFAERQWKQRMARYNNIKKYVVEHVSVPISGAVDLPNGRLEMVPELRYQTRNSIAAAKFPMHFDLKEGAVAFDLEAVAPFVDNLDNDNADSKIGDKYVGIRLPQDWREGTPFKLFAEQVFIADREFLNGLGKDAFVYLPVDDFGKQYGAKYRIGFQYNEAEIFNKMLPLYLKSVQAALEADQRQPNPSIPAELADKWRKVFANSDAWVERALADEDLAETLNEMTKHPVRVEYYLDERRRLVASRNRSVWDGMSPQKMNVIGEFGVRYTATPKMLMNPTAQNTADWSDKVFKGKKLADVLDALVSVTEEEPAVLEAEAEAAPAVKQPSSRKSKKSRRKH